MADAAPDTSQVSTQLTISVIRATILCFRRRLPLKYYIWCAFVRTLFWGLNGRQLQFAIPTVLDSYKGYIKAKRAEASRSKDAVAASYLREDVEHLEQGAALAWVGDRNKAQKFVLFLHGGGFVIPCQPGHLEWCYQVYVAGGAGVDTAVAVLFYTLAPAARYPGPLRQAAEAHDWILLESTFHDVGENTLPMRECFGRVVGRG